MVKALSILKQELPNYINEVKSKHSENAKAMAFSSFIQKVFEIESKDLDFEVPIKTEVMELRGRIDAVFGNLIIEFKKDIRKSLNEAEEELVKYFQAFHEKFSDSKYLGIVNDGIRFRVYYPIYENDIVIRIEEIDRLDFESSTAQDIFLWFDSYFFTSEKILPTSEDLKKRFGLQSPTFASIRRQLEELFKKVKDDKPVSIKYQGWLRYLEIVYGDKPNELKLFFKHTYLSTFVKLLVHVKLSGGKVSNTSEIVPILYGDTFKQYGVFNFMEEDFFTWIMFITIRKQASKLFEKLLRELYVYDLEKIDEDVLKELYQELVDPDVRKLLGEFYTPDWLADKMVREVFKTNPSLTMMDPSCGSGTFLFKTISFKIEELSKKGFKKSEILNHILESVIGFDIHPLAVTIAKTNYLLALKDLLGSRKGAITIPVYLSDSLKIPTKKMDVSTTVTSFEFEALDKKFLFPIEIASNLNKMDDIIEKMKEHGKEFERIYEINKISTYSQKSDLNSVYSNLLVSFERSLSHIQDKVMKEILIQNMRTLLDLIKVESNSIWTYVLRNMYKPVAISHSKVDIIIGNPPWLPLRGMKDLRYQDFLKDQSISYNLVDSKKIHNIPHVELATLFFCRCADMYLRNKGTIAFVMPKSVLIASHHVNFLVFGKPVVKLTKIFDLEKVKPLFRIISCVLIAIKGKENKFPVDGIEVEGMLKSTNSQLPEAESLLEFKKIQYSPAQRPDENSYYHDKFFEGATIVPRCFWFVNIKSDSFLGFNPEFPLVESEENSLAKKPWNIKLSGNVNKKFLYNTILSTDLIPFGHLRRRLIVLPILNRNKVEMISDSSQPEVIEANTSKYFKKTEELWIKNRTEKSKQLTVYQWLNYRNKLTVQKYNSNYKVLYLASGANLASYVLNSKEKYKINVGENDFVTDSFFVDYTLFYSDIENKDEAYYLSSILNSNTLNTMIKPLQAKGSFGPRHIVKLPLTFPFPKFDPNNKLHKELAEIGIICHKKVEQIIPSISLRSIGKIRTELRKTLAAEFSIIDKNVESLFEP